MKKYLLTILLLWFWLSGTSNALAQQQRPRTVKPPADTPSKKQTIPPLKIPIDSSAAREVTSDEPPISIETTEVLLPVTVRNRLGQFVPELKAEDFTVYEDNVPQPISSFALKRLPVHVLLMIDTSSSVQRELDDFKATALRFADKLDASDSLSLIRFDDKVELVLDWTTSRAALKRALSGDRLGTGMFTKFNDAMRLAAREQLNRVKGRKAIIVFTDGLDSGRGRTTSDEALRALVEAETPVYVVSKTRIQRRLNLRDLEYYENGPTGTPGSNQIRIDGLKLSLEALEASEKLLTRMVEETGGRLFLPQSFDNLDDAYQEVADELRNQYVIFYSPANTQRDGRYRTIRVKISRPSCSATTRLGYYLR